MLLSHRLFRLDDVDASLETRAIAHSRYRLHLVRNAGVVCEDELIQRAFDRKGAVGRPVLSVILAGRARVRVDGGNAHWLEAGDMAVFPSKSTLQMRQEGASYESIALEWDPGTVGGRPDESIARLDAHALSRLAASARAIRTDGTGAVDEQAGRFAELLSVLRSEGAPIERLDPEALVESVSEQNITLSRVLDRLLSHLDDRPMTVDLDTALGLSSRQVSRVVTTFNARYGFNAEGWRDTLNRRRISIAAALMSASTATTERVSHAVGYSSPTALCRAMAEAGLPAPGSIARAIRGTQ